MDTNIPIEFLGIWEQLNNHDFNPVEFDGIKKQAGLNSFTLTPKQWIEKNASVGIVSKAGRYGGTFAHKDIAFEFATWISVEFKLYLIKVPRERSRPTSVRHRRIRRIGKGGNLLRGYVASTPGTPLSRAAAYKRGQQTTTTLQIACVF